MSFRAIVVGGNERGQVGVGVGKAGDVIGAVRKGVADGKKHMLPSELVRASSVIVCVRIFFCSSTVLPAFFIGARWMSHLINPS